MSTRKMIRNCNTNETYISDFEEGEVREVGSKKNKYRMNCKIGSGAQGSAYKATDVLSGKEVIIKTTEDIESEEIGCLKKVTREFPNDPRYLQYIDDEETKVITDYDPNYITLESFLSEKKINKKDMLKIFRNIEDALDDLHKKRINHGDIKPSNILVHPKTLEIKMIDFGLCVYDSQYASVERNPYYSDDRQLYTHLYKNLTRQTLDFEPRSKNVKSCLDENDEIDVLCKELDSNEVKIVDEILNTNSKGLFLPKLTLDDALKLIKENPNLSYIILKSKDDNYLFLYKDDYRSVFYKELEEKSLIRVLKVLDYLLMDSRSNIDV